MASTESWNQYGQFVPLNRRRQEKLSDVVLICGGARFPAHRIILAERSSYFCAMFSNGMKESFSKTVEIHVPEPGLMEEILDYIYTDKITLSGENVMGFLVMADYLCLLDLKAKCSEVIGDSIDSSNVLEIASFAETFHCSGLLEKTEHFIRMNFTEVAQNDEMFRSLTPDRFVGYLSDEMLHIPDEKDLVLATLKWLESDPERYSRLPEVLGLIRLGRLDFEDFKELLWKNKAVRNVSSGCADLLLKAHNFFQDGGGWKEAMDLDNPLVRPRVPNEVLFINGGWSDRGPVGHFETYDLLANRWFSHHELEEGIPRAHAGVEGLNGKIFVMGGWSGTNYLSSVASFDPARKTWEVN